MLLVCDARARRCKAELLQIKTKKETLFMEYDYHMWLSIGLFVLTAIAMFTNKRSMGTISMISMLLFIFTGCLPAKTALAGFGNSAVVIFGSMYVIAEAFGRTTLPRKIANLVNKISKGSYMKVNIGLCLVVFLIGQFVPSASGVFAICYPVCLAVCTELEMPKKAIIWNVGTIAIALGSTLPLGSSALAHIEWNALLESYEYTTFMTGFMDKFISRIPAIIITLTYCIFIVPKIAPKETLLDGNSEFAKKKEQRDYGLTPFQDKAASVIFLLTMVGMMTNQLHNLDIWIVCLSGATLMVFFDILKPKEVYPTLGSGGGMIIVVVGMLAMGNALSATGAANYIGDKIIDLLGESPSNMVISGVYMGVASFITQFIMNAPVRNVLNAVCIMSCKQMSCSPVGLLCNIFMGANLSILTPLACATVPMVMGAGDFNLKDLLKLGVPLVIIVSIVTAIWTGFMMPAF